MIRRPLIAILVLIVLAYIACAALIAQAAPAVIQPAPLAVDAVIVADGVLVSWSTPYPQTMIFRRRAGEHDQFVDTVAGVTVVDCRGVKGDVYIVEALDTEQQLIARGRSAGAQWRQWLPVAGR